MEAMNRNSVVLDDDDFAAADGKNALTFPVDAEGGATKEKFLPEGGTEKTPPATAAAAYSSEVSTPYSKKKQVCSIRQTDRQTEKQLN